MNPINKNRTRQEAGLLCFSFAFASAAIGAISGCMQYFSRALIFAAVCLACLALAWMFNRGIRRG